MELKYKERHRYVTLGVYIIDIPKHIEQYILDKDHPLIRETELFDHLLYIPANFGWDGPSGPTIDSNCAMRGSLIHDVCYGLIEDGALNIKAKKKVDKWFRKLLKEDGMFFIRRWYWYVGLRWFSNELKAPGS